MNGLTTQITQADRAQFAAMQVQAAMQQAAGIGAMRCAMGMSGMAHLSRGVPISSGLAAQVSKPKNEEPKETKTMLSQMREYIKEYRTIIFTVAFVALADHFLFEGAFRTRLKTLVEGLLKKAEDKTNDA